VAGTVGTKRGVVDAPWVLRRMTVAAGGIEKIVVERDPVGIFV
jgi:hypothetical protein